MEKQETIKEKINPFEIFSKVFWYACNLVYAIIIVAVILGVIALLEVNGFHIYAVIIWRFLIIFLKLFALYVVFSLMNYYSKGWIKTQKEKQEERRRTLKIELKQEIIKELKNGRAK